MLGFCKRISFQRRRGEIQSCRLRAIRIKQRCNHSTLLTKTVHQGTTDIFRKVSAFVVTHFFFQLTVSCPYNLVFSRCHLNGTNSMKSLGVFQFVSFGGGCRGTPRYAQGLLLFLLMDHFWVGSWTIWTLGTEPHWPYARLVSYPCTVSQAL